MHTWRAKVMDYKEAAAYQDLFEEAFTAMRAPKSVALFSRGMVESTMLLPPGAGEIWERFSPNGWQDCPDAPTHKWSLLVGHADAAETFGLQMGSD